MFELIGIGIFIALLWIAWELHRFSQIVVNFMRGWEDAIARRQADEGN
ncbi:MAG: hypothetical protein WCC37_00685 [Candidatus Sulfotelmatobacter sp.]|jgi:hypothetical protein